MLRLGSKLAELISAAPSRRELNFFADGRIPIKSETEVLPGMLLEIDVTAVVGSK